MKNKERTTKELLIILRGNLKKLFVKNTDNGGMCSVIYDLWILKLISFEERGSLLIYLDDHTPESAYVRRIKYGGEYDRKGYKVGRFWWKPRAIKPRIDWLNQQIEML